MCHSTGGERGWGQGWGGCLGARGHSGIILLPTAKRPQRAKIVNAKIKGWSFPFDT